MEKGIFEELEGRYKLSFLDDLRSIEGMGAYVFGGMVRDCILGRRWKEADIRIVIPAGKREREEMLEKALAGYDLQGKTSLDAMSLTVYRFLPPGSSVADPIDLSLVSSIDDNPPDFTINSLFFDLIQKRMLDRFGGMADLQGKVIRTVKNPDEQLRQEPHMIFRAVKFACQLGFAMHPTVEESIRKNASCVQQTLDTIAASKKGIFVELFLGNIFKGLQADPGRYYAYMRDLGLFEELVSYASRIMDAPVGSLLYPHMDFRDFERNISHVFSCIVDSLIIDDKSGAFRRIAESLAITTPKEYSDFVVDGRRISYLG
jgi:tRNA nucleotidyltransferase/poly(A) polymerase